MESYTCIAPSVERVHSVYILIVAAATINFSLAWVQLLIKGSSYSRAAFINFGPILDSVIHKNWADFRRLHFK